LSDTNSTSFFFRLVLVLKFHASIGSAVHTHNHFNGHFLRKPPLAKCFLDSQSPVILSSQVRLKLFISTG